MPKTEDNSTYHWRQENENKNQDWGQESCLVKGKQLRSLIDTPVVKVEDIIIEVLIVFVIRLDCNIVHQAFDCNRQDIGLDKELGEDEDEDLEECEGNI